MAKIKGKWIGWHWDADSVYKGHKHIFLFWGVCGWLSAVGQLGDGELVSESCFCPKGMITLRKIRILLQVVSPWLDVLWCHHEMCSTFILSLRYMDYPMQISLWINSIWKISGCTPKFFFGYKVPLDGMKCASSGVITVGTLVDNCFLTPKKPASCVCKGESSGKWVLKSSVDLFGFNHCPWELLSQVLSSFIVRLSPCPLQLFLGPWSQKHHFIPGNYAPPWNTWHPNSQGFPRTESKVLADPAAGGEISRDTVRNDVLLCLPSVATEIGIEKCVSICPRSAVQHRASDRQCVIPEAAW